MRKHFIFSVVTFLIIAGFAALAVFLAKGYRLSTQNKMIFGTGILSITSVPDQASVYLDGHLTTATNANVNSLAPKTYDVKIVKDGFIPWEKKLDIKQGFVTDIKATLFPAIPTIYPLTYNGATKLLVSDDGQRAAFIVPGEGDVNLLSIKKGGVWVWDMKDQPVAFARGREPHQILSNVGGLDLTNATLQWSPDSNQVLVKLQDKNLLLNANSVNDTPRDITAILAATLQGWSDDNKTTRTSRLQTIKDDSFRKVASGSAYLKWSPDDTKLLYSEDGKRFKVRDLTEQKTFDLPEAKRSSERIPFSWLGDSRHLIMSEEDETVRATPLPSPINQDNAGAKALLVSGTISILEFDGGNKSVMYAGKFDPTSVFSWPDSSRLAMISSVPTPTGSQPNLFGINLK